MPTISEAERIRRQGGTPQPSDYTDAELQARATQLRSWLEQVETELLRRATKR